MHTALWNVYSSCYDVVWHLLPYRHMLDDITGALELRPGMTVLDAGCGSGNLEHHLLQACPGARITAVEAAGRMLARARRKLPAGTVSFVEADMDRWLSEPGESFDRIVTSNVLYTLPDPAHTLRLMTARLRPGGRMVHATPRWRFRIDVLLWRHFRLCRSWRERLLGLALLPALGLVGLVNLVIVIGILTSGKRSTARRRHWNEDWLREAVALEGLTTAPLRPTYAGQGVLIVSDKLPTSPTPEASP